MLKLIGHSQLLNIMILKFYPPVLHNLLGNISRIARKYDEIEPQPSGNPLGFALGISLGLRLYFIVYPSSHHNTDTVVCENHHYKSRSNAGNAQKSPPHYGPILCGCITMAQISEGGRDLINMA